MFLNQQTSHLGTSGCSLYTGPAAVLASQVAFSWCEGGELKCREEREMKVEAESSKIGKLGVHSYGKFGFAEIDTAEKHRLTF